MFSQDLALTAAGGQVAAWRELSTRALPCRPFGLQLRIVNFSSHLCACI